jgi:hypothetical protein
MDSLTPPLCVSRQWSLGGHEGSLQAVGLAPRDWFAAHRLRRRRPSLFLRLIRWYPSLRARIPPPCLSRYRRCFRFLERFDRAFMLHDSAFGPARRLSHGVVAVVAAAMGSYNELLRSLLYPSTVRNATPRSAAKRLGSMNLNAASLRGPCGLANRLHIAKSFADCRCQYATKFLVQR